MTTDERMPLVVISGPSGVGKDTVVGRLLELRDDAALCVSYTTRRPRKGEREGVDYHFVTRDAFESLLADDQMLEHQRVHENWYGTPASEVSKIREQDKMPLLILDTKGFVGLRSRGVECVGVFIDPPSMAELERRLRMRGTDDEEAIRLRMRNAETEMADGTRYDVHVTNRDVETCAHRLAELLDEIRN